MNSDPVPELPQAAFQALADPTRQAILNVLAQERLHVDELATRFPISRPAISKHLRLLKEAGLVLEAREGRRSYYGVNQQKLRELELWLAEQRRLWNSGLSRMKRALEKDDGRG
nr:metalloregulator ArsR/SmtB family transcription factor [uncultured Roseateles sp.]